MEKVIERMSKLVWQRRIFYLSLALFLSLMTAFISAEIIRKSTFLTRSVLCLAFFSIVSYSYSFYTQILRSVWRKVADFGMFASVGWMVGTITFYHLVPANSLTISYLVAVICGVISGGGSYFVHWKCRPNHLVEDMQLNSEEKIKGKIAKIVINANMWEFLAVGIIPFVIVVIK